MLQNGTNKNINTPDIKTQLISLLAAQIARATQLVSYISSTKNRDPNKVSIQEKNVLLH
jgi:hypothetical protein